MYSAIRANKRNTILIMMAFLAIIGAIGALCGYLLNDLSVTLWVVIVALIYAAIEYFMASRMAITMNHGVEVKRKEDNPLLWNTVENLAISTGLPMPRIFIIPEASPNAFATGRDPKHSYVAVTKGLLDIMDKRELNGVLAHEMSHIQNYDIRVSMIVYGLVAAITMLADFFLRLGFGVSARDDGDNEGGNTNIILMLLAIIAAVLAPIAAALVRMAVSRQREYLADSSAALMTRDPEGLAMALEKLQSNTIPMRKAKSAMAHMYINDAQKPSTMQKLFSTHPPIEDRIARLRSMGGSM